MIFEPTANTRNVLIAVRVDGENQRIMKISALFCDHEGITEGLYKDDDEAKLLLDFWRAIRPSDRIFSADVINVLENIRLRSWNLGLLPSLEIDLHRVYGTALHDTRKMGALVRTGSSS